MSLAREIGKRPELGMRLVGLVGQRAQAPDGLHEFRQLGENEDLPALINIERITRLFVAADMRDGNFPTSGPIFGLGGALYGVTLNGGYRKGICKVGSGCGVVYRITP